MAVLSLNDVKALKIKKREGVSKQTKIKGRKGVPMLPAIAIGLAAAFQATESGGKRVAQLIESARASTPTTFGRDGKTLRNLNAAPNTLAA